ncbi:unnamed protein product, partial [Iphiclides podalirius]
MLRQSNIVVSADPSARISVRRSRNRNPAGAADNARLGPHYLGKHGNYTPREGAGVSSGPFVSDRTSHDRRGGGREGAASPPNSTARLRLVRASVPERDYFATRAEKARPLKLIPGGPPRGWGTARVVGPMAVFLCAAGPLSRTIAVTYGRDPQDPGIFGNSATCILRRLCGFAPD